MAGYQTIEALRPILHEGPPAAPVVDRMRLYKPPSHRSPTAQQIKAMQAMRAAGISIPTTAKQTGFSQATVRRYTKNVTPPPGGWADGSRTSKLEASRAKVERLRRAGFTWDELAEEFGCAESTVRRFLKVSRPKPSAMTPMRIIVRAVRQTTGVPGPLIRRYDDRGGKVTQQIARARHITFWLGSRKAGLRQSDIAERLGGFDLRTVSRGIAIADHVARRLPITDEMQNGRIARLMWQAEWPKASA